ncbi:MAG TPA: phosphoribosylglycinamide synthetase C domain-containing protein [Spirochaetia bacterium]
MPMLGYDLGDLVAAMAGGTIASVQPSEGTGPGAALGVVVASRGYPERPEKGATVVAAPRLPVEGSMVFHASTSIAADGVVRVGGGRCFTAVGVGSDLADAARRAYAAAETVRFDGAWHRNDIGRKFIESPAPGACS